MAATTYSAKTIIWPVDILFFSSTGFCIYIIVPDGVCDLKALP